MRRCRGTRPRMTATAAILAVGLVFAPGAAAALTKISVSIAGTQTSKTHIFDQDLGAAGCANPTGDQSEKVSLHTYRKEILVVQPMDQGELFFDPNFTRTQREVLTRGTVMRTSTFTAGGGVACGKPVATCGTRSFHGLGFEVGPSDPALGGFHGISLGSGLHRPGDPFTQCRRAMFGATMFPLLIITGRLAPFTRGFLTSCRRQTATRTMNNVQHTHSTTFNPQYNDTTVMHLRITVTDLGCLRD